MFHECHSHLPRTNIWPIMSQPQWRRNSFITLTFWLLLAVFLFRSSKVFRCTTTATTSSGWAMLCSGSVSKRKNSESKFIPVKAYYLHWQSSPRSPSMQQVHSCGHLFLSFTGLGSEPLISLFIRVISLALPLSLRDSSPMCGHLGWPNTDKIGYGSVWKFGIAQGFSFINLPCL